MNSPYIAMCHFYFKSSSSYEDNAFCRNFAGSGISVPWCYVRISVEDSEDYIARKCCDIPICQPVLGLHKDGELIH